MHLLFLQTSYPVATTVDMSYASAYETTRDEIGPVKLQTINCDLYLSCLHLIGHDATLKNMKERKKGDDSRSISCFVHSCASLYL